MTEFDRKIVVVTGASSGIGCAAAEMFAARGARVALFARSSGKLDAIAGRHADRMMAVTGSVAEPADVERLFAAVESRFGVCDVLVNNAGMIDPKRVVDVTPEAWDTVFAVNVRGT